MGLIATARGQYERLQPGSVDANRLLSGDGLLITGVLAAIFHVVAGARRTMARLGREHDASITAITSLRLQLTQLPERLHIVLPAGPGKPEELDSVEQPGGKSRKGRGGLLRRIDVRKSHGLNIYGDAVTTTAAAGEHARLTQRIEGDAKQGITRHGHHVAPAWRWAARAVLFFDVLALLTLTLKLENVSTDVVAWQEQTFDQFQRLATAIGFALFAAFTVGVVAHFVGGPTYRYLHRETDVAADAMSRRYLIGAWSLLVALSILMGVTIFVRLHHEAGATNSGGSVGTCVALLIGTCGILAPLAVALVEAMDTSPEVQRRSALARILHGANHDEQMLARSIDRHHANLAALVTEAESLIEETTCAVDRERLAAHQAILTLRTEYGRTGEYVASIAYPERDGGFLADYDHAVQMKPLHDGLARMRAATPPAEPSGGDEQPSVPVAPLPTATAWLHDAEGGATPAA
ncbi:hypothetical protein [Mycolicibacterium cosmeticum]|uniref:hypothetical protein n=1 Tax=Mycolicibacterium cosmeticum TaxID=258533 RepID=UPI003204ACBA